MLWKIILKPTIINVTMTKRKNISIPNYKRKTNIPNKEIEWKSEREKNKDRNRNTGEKRRRMGVKVSQKDEDGKEIKEEEEHSNLWIHIGPLKMQLQT